MTDAGLPTSEHLEHLDTDTIADLIENLLPAPEAHRAREHVKACPDCQQTYDALLQLSEDLADEGRADIPIPTDIADHLDAVIVSESVLRASTVGVHSLVQFREQPRRHLPKLALVAAGALVVAGIGAGVMVNTASQSQDGAAGISPSESVNLPVLSTKEVAPQVQQLLETSKDPVVRGSQSEVACARNFAAGQPNPQLRLVQPARVDDRRATVIGLQGGSPRDIRVYVVTGCTTSEPEADPFYITNVTLRNR